MRFTRYITAFVLCALAIFAAAGLAAAGMKDSAAAKFLEFNSAAAWRYAAEFDSSGRLVFMAASDARAFARAGKVTREEATGAAMRFLASNAAMLGITDPSAFRVESADAATGATHVVLAHYHGNKPVDGSLVAVHVNGAGEVTAVANGSKVTGTIRSAAKPISAADAVRIAVSRVGCNSKRAAERTREIVRAANGAFVEVVRVEIPSREPLGDFVCDIDAATGAVIECRDVMRHAIPSKAVPLGSVYLNNPLRGPVVNAPLPNLFASSGGGLSGKWANVMNEDTAGATPDASGNYSFVPENTHFDEVMAYYHVNRIHDYYSGFGFKGLDRAMMVTVHYGNKYDNAFFSPQTGTMALGDGNKLNDLAKEETVIYHEYTHAVTCAIAAAPYWGESGAMQEAFSDYFPASITNDPLVGEWSVAKMNRPYIRNLENSMHYPEDMTCEVHHDSNIYSGALWDVRRALGAEKTDRIVHFSRYYLKGIQDPMFTDGLRALIAADKQHFGGANAGVITAAFEKRGIRLANAISTAGDYRAALKFAALEGDTKAAGTLSDLENGNLR